MLVDGINSLTEDHVKVIMYNLLSSMRFFHAAGVACFLRSLCATSSLQPACMQRTYIWPSPRADSTYWRTQPLHALCSRLHVGCPVFSGLKAGKGTSS